MPILAGTRFEDCEILGPLGSGGMGEVYRARDRSLGREVAVKVLPEELSSDPERLRRFEQEARAAATLSHPNILVVHRLGSTQTGAPYLVTELLQGQTLRERLRQSSVAMLKAVGNTPQQLTFGETSYLSPDVDHEGTVVATRERVDFDIWRFPVIYGPQENVRRRVQVTHQTGNVQTPSVAPDGREIVYLSDSGGHGNLWILNLETGQTRQLTFEQDPHVAVGVPVYSPDGHHIAYVNRGRTGWNVDQWVVNPDGNDAHKVSDGGGWACWSPDGEWLYVAPPTANGFRIEKVRPDGRDTTLVQSEGHEQAAGPEGTLYFTLSVVGVNGISDMEIRFAKPDNAPSQVLTRLPGSRVSPLMQPVLSPDGHFLLVLLKDGPTTNIWTVNTHDGSLKPVTDFGRKATFIVRRVSWSPDAKSVYADVGNGEADIVLLTNLKE